MSKKTPKVGDTVMVVTDSFPVLLPQGTVTVVDEVSSANHPPVPCFNVYVHGLRIGLYSDEIEVVS